MTRTLKGHIPVMPDKIVEYLLSGREGRIKVVDGTIGYGGHSSLILKANMAAELLGIDRDIDALDYAGRVLKFAGDRVRVVRGSFSTLAEHVIGMGWLPVDAVLLDLGISSPQIDNPERGFSIRMDGFLDMRMDSRSGMTAARVLNRCSEDELARIFRVYGEIRENRKLARAVVEKRKISQWSRTEELVELCEKVLRSGRRKSLPAATLCFQALRIYVNDELEELKKGLRAAVEVLSPGGRVAVISFHSLEDRIVKRFFKQEASRCLCPPGLPECVCNHVPSLKIITKKPLTASVDEVRSNPRASCAKLRIAEKI